MSEKIAVHTPTKESYDRLMKAYEKKGWNYKNPERINEFMYIDCHDNWDYGNRTTQINLWYTIITVEEALARLWQYERGQRVLVSMRGNIWEERTYLATIEWSIKPYVCLCAWDEDRFKNWEWFDTLERKLIKPLEEPIKEMTMQEVETALGHKVKIVK